MSAPGGGGRGRNSGRDGRPGGARAGGRGRGPVGGRLEPAEPVPDVHDPDGVRLQKVLAQAGLGSRRACEELIATGRVQVDGLRITEPGVRIDPRRTIVHVDGLRVQLDSSLVYLAMNKPRGVVSAMTDPQGRPCLGDYVADRETRLFHVGRLDADTEGLILLTNDGELANRLTHPRHGVLKTYLAEVDGQPARDLGRRLSAGVELEDGEVTVDSFRVVDAQPGRALVEVVLHEGRKHVVRRLLVEGGLPVRRLVRTRVGPIRLGDLRTGRTRVLAGSELGSLMAAVAM